MKTRRLFLKALIAAGALPFAPPALRRLRDLRVRPLGGGFHEVEGWILTDADLVMLRHHVS
jgi:hypothetical protein